MSHKTLIVDAGGTSTDWCMTDAAGNVIAQLQTEAVNMTVSARGVSDAIADAGALVKNAARIYYYGAGCVTPDQCGFVRTEFLRFAQNGVVVEVHGDMLGVARGLLGNRTGVACILGTGANTCLYDGEKIVGSIRPLGYILGDEGSGAALGKRFLKQLLRGGLHQSVSDIFYTETGATYYDIIENVYRGDKPNKYLGSFARFIHRHLDMPGMEDIVYDEFNSFCENFLVEYPDAQSCVCCGSIAYHFETQLKQVASRYGVTIDGIAASPVPGLIKYHLRHSLS